VRDSRKTFRKSALIQRTISSKSKTEGVPAPV
jgi:hypothetical protein